MFFLEKLIVKVIYSFYSFYYKRILRKLGIKTRTTRIIGRPIINVHPGGKLSIGKNFACLSGNRACVSSSNPTKLVVWSDASLIIGDGCGFSATAIACKNNIIIGDNVKIGSGSVLHDSDHHSLDSKKRRLVVDDRNSTIHGALKIGNDVFIGANCMILKGVTIGDGAIIGASSVVTKNIGSNEVWAGNPAKKIR